MRATTVGPTIVQPVRITREQKARFFGLAETAGMSFSSWARAAFEEKAAGSGALRGSSRGPESDDPPAGRPEPTRKGGSPPLPVPTNHDERCRCRGCIGGLA